MEQIVAAVKQHEFDTPAAEIMRKLAIAKQTSCRWKKEHGGRGAGPARELRQLREENAKPKKIVADLSLDKAMLTDITIKVVRAPRRREAVFYLGSHYGNSERRACFIVGQPRSVQ
ncbi:transposase [Lentisalinibacter sediminis]|uniref:transposase n=1 Tax=Lentisalinibacter sediminis TaxID=2992237 RepID=UPI0038681A31